jgi:hypothetical protein
MSGTTWLKVLLEGEADVPVMREVLQRRFQLTEDKDFSIYPHQGLGKLPVSVCAIPEPKHKGLLHRLPYKLRGYARSQPNVLVLVVLDVDRRNCKDVLSELKAMFDQLPQPRVRVLFRLAIEETESWFVADTVAVGKAFPKAKLQVLKIIQPDAVTGAWEKLAQALGENPEFCTGNNKKLWAEKISPHLNLDTPPSPSLRKLIEGIDRELKNAPII